MKAQDPVKITDYISGKIRWGCIKPFSLPVHLIPRLPLSELSIPVYAQAQGDGRKVT